MSKFDSLFEKQMHCWKGYKKKGTKKLSSGKVVNNCVKESYNEIYKSLITEMPYVDVIQDGEHTKFDLELEKYVHDLEGFKELIRTILQSGTVKDKYGNVIHLTSHEENMKFLSSLSDSKIVDMFLNKYHNTTLINIVRSLK
jgi:hypothetical protein